MLQMAEDSGGYSISYKRGRSGFSTLGSLLAYSGDTELATAASALHYTLDRAHEHGIIISRPLSLGSK